MDELIKLDNINAISETVQKKRDIASIIKDMTSWPTDTKSKKTLPTTSKSCSTNNTNTKIQNKPNVPAAIKNHSNKDQRPTVNRSNSLETIKKAKEIQNTASIKIKSSSNLSDSIEKKSTNVNTNNKLDIATTSKQNNKNTTVSLRPSFQVMPWQLNSYKYNLKIFIIIVKAFLRYKRKLEEMEDEYLKAVELLYENHFEKKRKLILKKKELLRLYN